MSDKFTIYSTTPPDDLPHKTRQLEITELPEYLKIRVDGAEGTERVLMAPSAKADNLDKIYIARNDDQSINSLWSHAPSNEHAGADGWVRWQVSTDDISEDILSTMLSIDSNGTLVLNYDAEDFVLGEADETTGKQNLQIADKSIGPDSLTDTVAGKGMVRNSSTDTAYQNRLDVNPDDSSLELYDSTPDETDEASKVWKLRVKDGGITADMVAEGAIAQTPVLTVPIGVAASSYTEFTSGGYTSHKYVAPVGSKPRQYNLTAFVTRISGGDVSGGLLQLMVHSSGVCVQQITYNIAHQDYGHCVSLSGLVAAGQTIDFQIMTWNDYSWKIEAAALNYQEFSIS